MGLYFRYISINLKIGFYLKFKTGPGVDSASNRNEYQEPSWGGKERPARRAHNLTAICEPNV
jgi:hypothetical protein